MTEDKDNHKEKTSMKRSPKDRHIDVRFTEDEFNRVLKNAQLSGRSKSIYLHDIAIGHNPSLPMTAEQQEALKGLTGVRAELVYVRMTRFRAEETLQESRLHGALASRCQRHHQGMEPY